MFDWLHRLLGRSRSDGHRKIAETVDALNAEAGGGEPIATTKHLGELHLWSGTLALGDPQDMPGLEIPNVPAGHVEISASMWRYPNGSETITALHMSWGESTSDSAFRKIGEIGIDSAKLVVADKADIEKHWTKKGKDRIGVISTTQDDTLLRQLTKRFKLKTVRVNRIRAEVVGPVSEPLADEIKAFLMSDPRYADYPFMHFYVQTNNSFERVNFSRKEWEFMPVGNSPEPLMFACGTGRGDGCYAVLGQFDGNVPRVISIQFIEDPDGL